MLSGEGINSPGGHGYFVLQLGSQFGDRFDPYDFGYLALLVVVTFLSLVSSDMQNGEIRDPVFWNKGSGV